MTLSKIEQEKIINKIIKRSKISIRLMNETESIEENIEILAGSSNASKKVATALKKELLAGNQWAWCSIEVRLDFEHEDATDWIGCCSYADESDFKQNGPYQEMVRNCAKDIFDRISKSGDLLKELRAG